MAQVAPVREFPFGWGQWPTSSGNPDKGGLPFFCIQDPVNYDVLVFFDKSGEVVDQYTWEPYGTPVIHEVDADVMPVNRVGHHGIFFDRIDTQTIQWGAQNTDTFEVGGTLIGHVRNRTYWPAFGKWGQRDPNETAQILSRESYSGDRASVTTGLVNPRSAYSGGANLYGYCGAGPIENVDSNGLWFGMAFQLASMGLQSWTDASDTLQDAQDGLRTGFNLGAMLDSYSITQESDVDWATDWSQADDWYSGAPQIARAEQTNLTQPNPFLIQAGWKGRNSWTKNAAKNGNYFKFQFKPPSRQAIHQAVQKAKQQLGRGNMVRNSAGDNGSPTWGAHQGSSAGKGYRIDPAHPNSKNPLERENWHINGWNNDTGEKFTVIIE